MKVHVVDHQNYAVRFSSWMYDLKLYVILVAYVWTYGVVLKCTRTMTITRKPSL